MIILHDGNPLTRVRRAWVNQGIVVACIVIYVLQVFELFPWRYLAFFPHQLWTWAPAPGPLHGVGGLVTHMFLHGNVLHVVTNVMALLVFGNNLEDALGHRRYLLFYLLCGAAAGLAQALTNPGSELPMVGASGAIAGVSGAYLLFFPHSRVVTLVPIFLFLQVVEIPAVFFLVVWFLWQVLSGVASLRDQAAAGGDRVALRDRVGAHDRPAEADSRLRLLLLFLGVTATATPGA